MNEQNYNPENPNWNLNTADKKLPNSNGTFVLGIISLCVSTVCCFCYGGFPGVIISIIGIFLGHGAIRNYNENPGIYSEKTYRKAKSGRMMSWIGLVLSLLACAFIVTYLYLGFTGQLPHEFQKSFDRSSSRYNFD